MLTGTQTFNKSIHLSCCAQREKDVVKEFLESPLTAASIVIAQETKKNEEDSTTVLFFQCSQQLRQKTSRVTNFTTVTICAAHSYQAQYFLMPNTVFHVSINQCPVVATSQFAPVEIPSSQVPVNQIMPYGPPSQKVNIQYKFDPWTSAITGAVVGIELHSSQLPSL
jgi:hypothetical protein